MTSIKLSKKFIYASLAAFIWAITIILERIILKNGESALNLVFWMTVMAMPYWLFVLGKNIDELKSAPIINFLILIAIGVIGTAGGNLMENISLKHTAALNFSLLIRSSIFFTIIFASIFLKEKITLKKIILLLLILVGSFLLITKGQKIALAPGDIYVFITAIIFAFGNTVLGKMATNRMSPKISSSMSYLISLVPVTIIAILSGAIAWPKMPILVLLFAIINASIAVFRFLAYKNASASYVTMMFSVTPVFVSIFAISFMGETITPIQIVGGILIILAGIFVEKLKI